MPWMKILMNENSADAMNENPDEWKFSWCHEWKSYNNIIIIENESDEISI